MRARCITMQTTHVLAVALLALALAAAIEYGNKKEQNRPVNYATVFVLFALAFGFGMAALVFFSSDSKTEKPDLFRNVRQGDPAF